MFLSAQMFLHEHGQMDNPAGRIRNGKGLLPLEKATGAGGNHRWGLQSGKIMHEPVTDPPGNIRVDNMEKTALAATLRPVFKFEQDQFRQPGQQLPGLGGYMQSETQVAGVVIQHAINMRFGMKICIRPLGNCRVEKAGEFTYPFGEFTGPFPPVRFLLKKIRIGQQMGIARSTGGQNRSSIS